MTLCIIWTKYINPDGYGQKWDGRSMRMAHRVIWEEQRGSIPEGMELDHLCKTRACVNLDHLELVTRQQNIERSDVGSYWRAKTQCRYGHSPEKYVRGSNGKRHCSECKVLRSRIDRAASRGR